MSKREHMNQEASCQCPPSKEILVCSCGWYGEVEDQDALGSECGCCPDCGNEDLIWLNKLQERIKELEDEKVVDVRCSIDSEGKYTKYTYCYGCGAGVRNQKYCCQCGRKLNWQARKG